jgi:hypothetical protein
MFRSKLVKALVVTATAAIPLLAPSAASAAPLVDQTIDGPIGGAQVCVIESCFDEVQGVANLRIVVDVTPGTVAPPVLTTGSAPGCTANINVALFATTAALGAGSATVTVTYDRTDMNGNILGSETLGGTPVVLPPVLGTTVPLASVCATLF